MSHRGVIVDRTGRSIVDETGRCVVVDDDWSLTMIVSKNFIGDMSGVDIVEVGELTPSAVDAAVAEVRRRGPIDRIATISEYLLMPVAELREAYGIPGPSVEYSRRLRDKWSMKERASEFRIRHNPGLLAKDIAAGNTLPRWEAGYVLKPRAESGSRGVRTFPIWSEVANAVADLVDQPGNLIELFNDAEVLHIDGFIVDGRATMEVSRYLRPCYITGRSVPLSSVTIDEEETIMAATLFVDNLLRAWEIHDDVFHCEVFADKAGMTLCEVAGRPGGAGVPAVFSATRGVDLRHAKLRLDLGLEPTVSSVEPIARHGGWTVIYPPAPGLHAVEDAGLSGHHTRHVLTPTDPWIEGLAGIGVATYSFANNSTEAVRTLIERYEREVRVLPYCQQGADTL